MFAAPSSLLHACSASPPFSASRLSGSRVPGPCLTRGMAELDAERGVEEDGVLNAAPYRSPPAGEGRDHAVLRGRRDENRRRGGKRPMSASWMHHRAK